MAEVLQVPAPLIGRLPVHWIGSAMTHLESRARIAEMQRKRAEH